MGLLVLGNTPKHKPSWLESRLFMINIEMNITLIIWRSPKLNLDRAGMQKPVAMGMAMLCEHNEPRSSSHLTHRMQLLFQTELLSLVKVKPNEEHGHYGHWQGEYSRQLCSQEAGGLEYCCTLWGGLGEWLPVGSVTDRRVNAEC